MQSENTQFTFLLGRGTMTTASGLYFSCHDLKFQQRSARAESDSEVARAFHLSMGRVSFQGLSLCEQSLMSHVSNSF